MELTFTLNGRQEQVTVSPDTRLVDLLRSQFGLTGTKEACGQGECGACTVLFNNRPVNACLLLASQVQGGQVITIEGLAPAGELDPVQTAFLEAGAVQCGYCTPGMVMAAKGLLLENPNPTDEEILDGMSGNLCRCTGYVKIIEAVHMAARGGEPNDSPT